MPKTSTLLEPNIYEDPHGYRVKIARIVNGRRVDRERHFPPGTPLATLRAERLALLESLETDALARVKAEAARVVEGPTLAEGVRHWLDELRVSTTPKGDENARFEAEPWLTTALAGRGLLTLDAADLNRQYAIWINHDRVAASTVNKRRQALMHVYRALKLRNVAAESTRQDEATYHTLATLERGVPVEAVDAILAAHADTIGGRPNLTKIRHRVMATTGLTQALVAQIRPGHYTPAKGDQPGALRIAPRHKGRGAKARTIVLLPAADAAVKDLIAHKAFGPWKLQPANRQYKRAVARARKDWEKAHGEETWPVPADYRPYDLRHSYLTLLYVECGDVEAVGYAAGHAPGSKMASRYTSAGLEEGHRRAVAKLAAALPSTFAAPATPGKTLAFRRRP